MGFCLIVADANKLSAISYLTRSGSVSQQRQQEPPGRTQARGDADLDEPPFTFYGFLPRPAATSQGAIIAIIMKKQPADPFYNVRVVNYLLGTKLFGTQRREKTE